MSLFEHSRKKHQSGYCKPFSILPLALLAVICVATTTCLFVFADGDLLCPGASRIQAGSSMKFVLNMSDLSDEAEFAVTVSVKAQGSTSEATMSCSEDSGAGAGTEYSTNSSLLGSTRKLHFTVTPPEDIAADTEYVVTASITGGESASDSFTFTAIAINQGGDTPGEDDPTKDDPTKDNPGKDMPSGKSGKMSGGSMSGGTAASSSSTDTASVTYAGSWDNYLDSLSVDGYEFTQKFNKTRDTYFLTVDKDVTAVDVSATASDSSAIVAIAGNRELAMGRNKIMVNVTADDGSVRVYRIYVTRSATTGTADSNTEDSNEETE